MLLENAPKAYCPSMKPTTVVGFMLWKTGKKGKHLIDPYGSVVKDVFGQPITCTQMWKDPGNAAQMCSALNAIHCKQKQTGDFEDSCPSCQELPENQRYMGCHRHPGKPQC